MKSMRKSKYYNRWGGEKKLLQGVMKRHPDGFGFVIPDDSGHPDIYIPFRGIGSAMTNDRVEAAVQKKRGRPNMYFGYVESILKRFREFAVGPYEILKTPQGKEQAALCSHNLSGAQPILLNNPKGIAVKEGDWVKAKITSWPEGGKPFAAALAQNLGAISSSAKDDSKRVLAERDIALDFPEEALREANCLPDEVKESDFSGGGRKDLRDKSFVTIDGANAKDFDDAIYVERLSFGFKLFAAIADVSHYVAENSFLDKEAHQRGNSVYLPGFCVPMLPEKLSNGLCSLKPGKPRLALIEEMDFNPQGEMIRSEFYPAVIESRRRLTYGEAQEMLDGFRPLGDLAFLKEAKKLAETLLKKNSRDGALNLDIPETVVAVNQMGEPTDLLREERLFTHRMIEQFMLAANIGASAFLEKKKAPLMYRAHEAPKEDKLQQLEIFSRTLGFARPLSSRENLIRFLSQFQDHSKKALIGKLVLRSLCQARYTAFNKGHYGLNFSSYTHFTSPIRRYCDLLIHRLIKKTLAAPEVGVKPPSKPPAKPLSQKSIEKIAAFISEREQNAVKAERQVKDIKKTRFLSSYLGQNFSGVISSVTSFGLFIALDDFDVEGLARFRDLPGQWVADEINLRASGKRSGYTMKFGDKVETQLAAARPLTGNLDFKLISHEGKTLPKESAESAGRRSGKKKGESSAAGGGRQKTFGRKAGKKRSASAEKKSRSPSEKRSAKKTRRPDRQSRDKQSRDKQNRNRGH